jgi:hypothetical protein
VGAHDWQCGSPWESTPCSLRRCAKHADDYARCDVLSCWSRARRLRPRAILRAAMISGARHFGCFTNASARSSAWTSITNSPIPATWLHQTQLAEPEIVLLTKMLSPRLWRLRLPTFVVCGRVALPGIETLAGPFGLVMRERDSGWRWPRIRSHQARRWSMKGSNGADPQRRTATYKHPIGKRRRRRHLPL